MIEQITYTDDTSVTLKYLHWIYAKQYYYLNYNLGGDRSCANYRASSTVMIVFTRQ